VDSPADRGITTLLQRGFEASLDVEGLATLLDCNTATLTTAELPDAERKLGVAHACVRAMMEFARTLQRLDESRS
jgi:hypothetical protein